MKRNCTLLVLLLAILLCVGCSNPSDKVEGNLPPVDSGETGSDMMATPADVLRNLNKDVIEQVSIITSRTLDGSQELQSVPYNSESYNFSITANPSALFNVILTNDVAKWLEDNGKNSFMNPQEDKFVSPEITEYLESTKQHIAATAGGDMEFAEYFLKDIKFNYLKFFKDSEGSVWFYYIVEKSHGDKKCPMYCILKCTQNSKVPAIDSEFVCIDKERTGNHEGNPTFGYYLISSNTFYNIDSKESNTVQSIYDSSSPNNEQSIIMRERIIFEKEGTTYFRNSDYKTGATFVDKNGKGGCGLIKNGNAEVYDDKQHVLYLQTNEYPHLIAQELCSEENEFPVISIINESNQTSTSFYSVGDLSQLQELNCTYSDFILGYQSKLDNLKLKMNSSKINETFKENHSYISIDLQKVDDWYNDNKKIEN